MAGRSRSCLTSSLLHALSDYGGSSTPPRPSFNSSNATSGFPRSTPNISWVSMLLSFLGIYFAKGTFDFTTLASLGKHGLLTGRLAWLAFAGIFVGLAVKVPLFPFHTWLPDAYQTAPTGVSMVLTGVLSKMG